MVELVNEAQTGRGRTIKCWGSQICGGVKLINIFSDRGIYYLNRDVFNKSFFLKKRFSNDINLSGNVLPCK